MDTRSKDSGVAGGTYTRSGQTGQPPKEPTGQHDMNTRHIPSSGEAKDTPAGSGAGGTYTRASQAGQPPKEPTADHDMNTRNIQSLEGKDPENVARGLNAALHNPNVSEEAKEHVRERLDLMGKVIDT